MNDTLKASTAAANDAKNNLILRRNWSNVAKTISLSYLKRKNFEKSFLKSKI